MCITDGVYLTDSACGLGTAADSHCQEHQRGGESGLLILFSHNGRHVFVILVFISVSQAMVCIQNVGHKGW